MNNAFLKMLFIAVFALFICCANTVYSKSMDYLSLNTAPVTLSPEELQGEEDAKVPEASGSVVIKPKKIETSTTPIKNANYKSLTLKSIKNPVSDIISPRQTQSKKSSVKTVKSLEILDYDADENVLKNKESESFLLVPIDKEQLEAENKQYQLEDLSTSLIKDAPKTLNTKAKLKSRIYAYILKKYGRTLDINLKKMILISFIVKLLILTFVVILGVWGYFFYKKRRELLAEKERIQNLSYEEKKRKELINAIEEFEQAEESHKKLGPKVYINELEKYKSLEGFKRDEVADDIINTMETIEKAQKNETPLTLKDKQTIGFKKNNYAFENDIGTLSDEEGIALFDEDSDSNDFSSEEEFLNPDYYSENSEILKNAESANEDIFIIEEDDEPQDDEYTIVEEKPSVKAETKNQGSVNKTADSEENVKSDKNMALENQKKKVVKKEKKPEEPKLEIQERYPLDDNRGFALLSYKQTIALIGYIGEKITVLKKFSQNDNAKNLSVRMYEEISDNNAQYLV